MKKGNKFSSERLYLIRRMRRARYLAKCLPLFAFQLMAEKYPGYSYGMFIEDLRYRRKPKRRRGRTQLSRYGRYQRMQQLVAEFSATGDISKGIMAQRLRSNMAKPYSVRYRSGENIWFHSFSPMIPLDKIERFFEELKQCDSVEAIELAIAEFNRYSHIN